MKPDRRLQDLSWHLQNLAARINDARTHLQTELNHLDGHPTRNDNETVKGGGRPDPTATIGDQRARLTLLAQQLEDWVRLTQIDINRGRMMIDGILRHREQHHQQPILCNQGGFNKTLSPRLAADIATCHSIPHAKGLCINHYRRWRRETEPAHQ